VCSSDLLAGGQARAVVFFLVLAVISLIQVSVNKKREIEL
jgi:ABC-type sugar transport system permease subunit